MSEHAAAAMDRMPALTPVAKNLPPSAFAMVMATGIVSIAAFMLGMQWIAIALFAVTIAAYAVLVLILIMRVISYRDALLSDFVDHQRAPGFFTIVAGSGVLGAQFVLISGDHDIAMVLWIVATVLWVVLIYGILAALWLKHRKPSLASGINGGWLLAVVATQAIVVLGALVTPHWLEPYRLEFDFFGLALWLCGGMLYIWMIALIFYRYTFFDVEAENLSPTYWIIMGAMAISTLAGSLLIMRAPEAPFLDSLLPFLRGFTVFYWATGTWWIPMLVILAVWRYAVMRVPLRYDPLHWGAVFPLGMYASATWQMARVMDLDFLRPLAEGFAYLALVAWTATFIGLLTTIGRALMERSLPSRYPPA